MVISENRSGAYALYVSSGSTGNDRLQRAIVEFISRLFHKLILAKKREAMKAEKQSSVYFIHDCYEEGSLQADLKQKWV